MGSACSSPEKTSFVLVGGMMHAAKHWEKLRPKLEAEGHEAIAVELPGLGEDTSDPAAATLESHIAAIVAAIDGAKNKPVVLVGHSLAGVTISGAAEQRAEHVRQLVFLAAETRPGAGWMETATKPGPEWLGEGLLGPTKEGLMFVAEGKLERLGEVMFSGATKEDQVKYAQLLRPQPGYSEDGLKLTERFAALKKLYIKTQQDQVNLPQHQDTWIARLGNAAQAEIDSGHAPFISKPDELASILLSMTLD